LWLLPILDSGGGGNVVVFKAKIMRAMGLPVSLFNLPEFRDGFERSYPGLDVPVIYGAPESLPAFAADFDAAIATVNFTVSWLGPLLARNRQLKCGYFAQDFEPYFYDLDSPDYQRAWQSYALYPDLIRFANSPWVQQEVIARIGVTCELAGPCYNTDLFRPRPRSGKSWPDRPVRVAAMIRPETPRRAPRLTMEVLRQLDRKYGGQIDIWLFGTSIDQPAFTQLPQDFHGQIAGKLCPEQMASFLNDIDIFVDFSTYQALGITAQEAMACGAAVVVPQQGGATCIAEHGRNALFVDSASVEACRSAVERLIDDHELRARLQHQAISDVCNFYPERPTYNILRALFKA
jgi:glycosyltransferase involved in cell wall biosynthesis